MLVASSIPFGGFTEDVVDVLGPILGRDRVLSFTRSLENKIRSEAEAGARQTIPDIRAEVERTATAAVMPWVLGAAALGLLGAGLGAYAIWRK